MKAQTMATFQKSSSRSDESAYTAKMLSGLDRGEFRIVLKDLIERNFDPIVQFANKLSEALSRLFETIAREFNALVQKIEAAPEIPSYEKLLIEKTGYGPLLAKFMAHQICHWGRSLAAKINEGRKVRTNIDKIADAGGGSTLVMSRLAKKFRDQCRSVEVQNLIESAIKKANLPLTAVEFDRLVERACERDENACRNLGRLSQQLAPHLPEKRGRPISAETCTHLILLWWLESSGHKCAYTSSPDNAGFTDPVNSSHAIGLGQRRLQPAICTQAAQEKFSSSGSLFAD